MLLVARFTKSNYKAVLSATYGERENIMKFVLGATHSGFYLSPKGEELLKERAPYMFDKDGYMLEDYYKDEYALLRNNPLFIDLVEEHEAKGTRGLWPGLKVISMSDDVTGWEIVKTDGREVLSILSPNGCLYTHNK